MSCILLCCSGTQWTTRSGRPEGSKRKHRFSEADMVLVHQIHLNFKSTVLITLKSLSNNSCAEDMHVCRCHDCVYSPRNVIINPANENLFPPLSSVSSETGSTRWQRGERTHWETRRKGQLTFLSAIRSNPSSSVDGWIHNPLRSVIFCPWLPLCASSPHREWQEVMGRRVLLERG